MISVKHLLVSSFLGGMVLTTPSISKAEVPFLGFGYISQTDTLVSSPCLIVNKDNIRYSGAQTSSFKLIRSTDVDQMLLDLNVEYGGKISLEGMTLSGSQKYAINMAEDEYSDSVVISYVVRGKTATFDGAKPSEQVLHILNTAENKESEVKKICGDKFVSSVELGADLNIGFKVTYLNKSFKTRLKAEIQGDILKLIQGKGSADAIINKFANKAVITIGAYQRGGDPSKLADILEADNDKVYHIFKCGLGSVKTNDGKELENTRTGTELEKLSNEHCRIALDGMLVYMKDSFPEQIGNLDYNVYTNKPGTVSKENPVGAAIINAKYLGYKEGGYPQILSGTNSLYNKLLTEKRNKIFIAYKKLDAYLNKLNTFIGLRYLDQKDLIDLENKQTNVKDALSKAIMAGNFCYSYNPDKDVDSIENKKNEEQCNIHYTSFDVAYSKIKSMILSPDSLKINQNFYHFCRLRKEVGQEVTCRTIKKLAVNLQMLGGEDENSYCSNEGGYTDDEVSQCSYFYEILLNQSSLNLSSAPGEAKVIDLTPISNLSKLEAIDLSGNNVSDLSPIGFLGNNIEELNLSGNSINNLASLERFTNLKKVDLSNNKIDDLMCREKDMNCEQWRGQVELIDLSGNEFRDILGANQDSIKFYIQNNSLFKKTIYNNLSCDLLKGCN